MEYVCDAPNGMTWFRLETEAEAAAEAESMNHAVDKHFSRARKAAADSFVPPSDVNFEQLIGLEAHIKRTTPLFLSLRDQDGVAHVTAMLPQSGPSAMGSRMIVVGESNHDPYPLYSSAIEALGNHLGMMLPRSECFPYAQ